MRRGVFDPLPVALARIPLLPLAGPASTGPAAVDPLVREGMFLASRQAGALVTGAFGEPRGGRAAVTARSYTLRARSRPTPHGVFAGVATARFSDVGSQGLAMGGCYLVRTVPDPGWLDAVAHRLLDQPDVLELLTLSASNLAVRRGGRLEQERPAEPGVTGVRRVSVRATDATNLVMEVCAGGARWSTILHAVTLKWPAAPESSVRSMVMELVRRGFLLADLLPDHSTSDPLGHLLVRIPATNEIRRDLAQVRRHLADADACQPGQPRRLELLATARDAADRILRHEHPFCADVALDTELILPARLAREAADAASVLWRIGSAQDPLDGFHDRFADRYGYHRFVRLIDALDPVIGIAGADQAGSSPARARETVAVLAAMIASVGHGIEVELETATIEALAAASGSSAALPPETAEVYARVIAESQGAAAAGRFRLAMSPTGGTQEAGSTSGRFASLLPRLRETFYRDGEALVAELVVRARTPSGAALAPETEFAAHRIPLGVPVRPGDIALEDLLLISDGRRLLLWSASMDQRVVPVLFSRLSPHLLPPVAQLLRLLGQHGCRPWRPWSWGPMENTPFQPRVRYQRTILSPARWTLPPAVTSVCGRPADWDSALDTWRSTTVPGPPDVVVVAHHDQALPVDLRCADDRALLRRHVQRGMTAVTEQPGGADAVQGVVTGPAGRHALELVVSLTAPQTDAAPRRPRAGITAARQPDEGLYLPGSSWLSIVIRTPATCQDEVLTCVAATADRFSMTWFWLRYTDHAGPHLRIRFHGHPAHLGGQVLPAMAALVGDLIAHRLASGLSVEPYEQEIERYGGTLEAMTAAEQVFAADSRLTLAMLTAIPDTEERIVVAALSAMTITQVLTDGDRAALAGRHVDRNTRRTLTQIRPRTRTAARTTPGTITAPPVNALWHAREQALTAYHSMLNPADQVRCASSVIHMHINRLLGDTVREPLIRALAIDMLYTRDARSAAS